MQPVHIRFGGYQPPASMHSQAAEILGKALATRLGQAVCFDLDGTVVASGHQATDLLTMVEVGALTMCYFSASYLAARVPAFALISVMPYAPSARQRTAGGYASSGHFFGTVVLLCHQASYAAWPAEIRCAVLEAAAQATAAQRRCAVTEDVNVLADCPQLKTTLSDCRMPNGLFSSKLWRPWWQSSDTPLGHNSADISSKVWKAQNSAGCFTIGEQSAAHKKCYGRPVWHACGGGLRS